MRAGHDGFCRTVSSRIFLNAIDDSSRQGWPEVAAGAKTICREAVVRCGARMRRSPSARRIAARSTRSFLWLCNHDQPAPRSTVEATPALFRLTGTLSAAAGL